MNSAIPVSADPPPEARRIRAELARQERSQAWLARRLGVSPPSLTRYLRGERGAPLGFWADAFGHLGIAELAD